MDVIMDPVSMIVSIGVKEISKNYMFVFLFLSTVSFKKKMYFFIVIVKILKFKI